MPSPGPTALDFTPGDTSADSKRLDIQGLRAVAVLVVVAFHAGLPVPGGFIGVDVFFVISGFVITSMLQREFSARGRIRFGQFYFRRFKRLTPALSVMVTTTVVGSALILSPLGDTQQTAAKTAIGAMLLVANLVIASVTGGYFDLPAATNPLLNTWSLSVEEQFYLVFPAVLALAWVLARRTRVRLVPALFVIAVTAASFALAVIGSTVGTGPRTEWAIGFYGPVGRAWEFGVGALLAVALTGATPRFARLRTGGAVVGAVLIAASLWLITERTPFPGMWTLLPVVGTALVILGGWGDQRGAVSWLLSLRPAVVIGDWSYSIYLWHWPLIVFASIIWKGHSAALVVAATVSFLPAVASYRWVEQPLRRLPTPSGRSVVRLVSVTVVVPLVAALALWTLANHSWFSDAVRARQSLTERIAVGLGCQSVPGAVVTPDATACAVDTDAAGPRVYLVGDSNAGQFTEALMAAADREGRQLSIAVTAGCPFTPLYVGFEPDWMHWNVDDQCRKYSDQTLAWLEHQPPGTVVIANSDDPWRDDHTRVGTSAETATSDPSTKVKEFESGLTEAASRLKAAGHSVILVQTIPFFEGDNAWDPRTCTALAVFRHTCTAELPLADYEANQGSIREAVRSAAEHTGAAVLDLSEVLCTGDVCSPTSQQFPYRDAHHLSVVASENLASEFASALRAAD